MKPVLLGPSAGTRHGAARIGRQGKEFAILSNTAIHYGVALTSASRRMSSVGCQCRHAPGQAVGHEQHRREHRRNQVVDLRPVGITDVPPHMRQLHAAVTVEAAMAARPLCRCLHGRERPADVQDAVTSGAGGGRFAPGAPAAGVASSVGPGQGEEEQRRQHGDRYLQACYGPVAFHQLAQASCGGPLASEAVLAIGRLRNRTCSQSVRGKVRPGRHRAHAPSQEDASDTPL